MKLTARELRKAGVVEQVFPEPEKFTKENLEQVTGPIKRKIRKFLDTYEKLTGEELSNHRYERFRRM